MINPFLNDIHEQPAALRELVRFYRAEPALLGRLAPPPKPLLLTGMGASHNAAAIAATWLQSHGIAAQALEASELLFAHHTALSAARQVVFVSQSGGSAEVVPIGERLGEKTFLLAVSNNGDSPLAQRAHAFLPLSAGRETALVATKTYVNSLAVLWLLTRHWLGRADGSELQTLLALADLLEARLALGQNAVEPWLERLDAVDTLLFAGHGAQAATARQAAMMMNEWAKMPAIGMSAGSFRHGPIELSDQRLGVVLFAGDGPSRKSARQLAAELRGYGTRVLEVFAGQLAPDMSRTTVLPELTPALDVLPAQLFCEAWTRRHGVDPTFRRIQKVISKL